MTKSLQTLPWLTKINIPAEIQDFWFRAGKKIGGISATNLQLIYHCSDDEYYSQGGPPPPLREDVLARGTPGDMLYFIGGFHGQHYSEMEMLKVIKLMAFL